MPSANTPALYDFENVFEEAAAAKLRLRSVNSEPLTVYTRLNAAELERESNRVEVRLQVGECDRSALVPIVGDSTKTCRWMRWHGVLSFQVVTQIQPNDNLHGLIKAQVRDVAESLYDLINPTLPYHSLDEIIASGTTPTFRGADGYEASTLVYGVQFSIRADAWPQT